jgi:hypothetical protein
MWRELPQDGLCSSSYNLERFINVEEALEDAGNIFTSSSPRLTSHF